MRAGKRGRVSDEFAEFNCGCEFIALCNIERLIFGLGLRCGRLRSAKLGAAFFAARVPIVIRVSL